MSQTLDTASFTLPPAVAKLDAVRKLIPRLMEVTGLGETAAATVAHAAVDPAAVRAALAEPLPGLTAHKESHLRVIPMRVWTPWLTPPADDIARYSTQKRYPASDPSIPKTPRWNETQDGLVLEWDSPADRDYHLEDNRKLYALDIHRDSLRIFPESGGIVFPLVLVPQTETFQDGTEPAHRLRVTDGRYRYYGVMDLLERYAALDQAGLDGHFGPGVVTPEVFRAALDRDRRALAKVVNAVRDACLRIEGDLEAHQFVGVHYLASILSLPAYVTVGAVDPETSEIRPMGTATGYPTGTGYALETGMVRWHTGSPAKVVSVGQVEFNGLLLPEASVDTEMIGVAAKRLRARGVPKDVIEFGSAPDVAAAARLVWWTRAVRQLGGTPATAVAAFAVHSEGPLSQTASRPLLKCASYLMEEDFEVPYPFGDYREREARPDSLSLLVSDVRNLAPVAALSDDGRGGLLVHPRWHNATHIALSHLALMGVLPATEKPLPEHIVSNIRLLSEVATAWAAGRAPVVVRPDGAVHRDGQGRTVPVDAHTLNRSDMPWPKGYETRVGYLMPPPAKHAYDGASHVFKLRHDVIYTVPQEPIGEVEATPENIAAVVRRWFPHATGVTLTDWSDKFVTGVMVGSVWVQLFDRKGEREDARSRGVWYPEGKPPGTKDILVFDSPESEVPVGSMFGIGDWITEACGEEGPGIDMVQVDECMFEELDSDIIQEVDDALEAQKADDVKKGQEPRERWDIPVLRLPEPSRRTH